MLRVLLYHTNETKCSEIENHLDVYALKTGKDLEVYKNHNSVVDLYARYGDPFVVMTFFAEYVAANKEHVITGFKEIRQTNKDSYLVAVVDDYDNISLLIKPALRISGIVHADELEASLYPVLDEILADYSELNGLNAEAYYSCWSDGELYRIPLKDIIFFERQARSVVVRTNLVEIPLHTSLEKLEETLGENFNRVHKSFLMNVNKVTGIQNQERQICMEGGYKIPVSKKNFGEVKRNLMLSGNKVNFDD